MRNQTRLIAAAAAVTAAVAGGSAAAVASTTGAKPSAPATMSASEKPGGSQSAGEQQGQNAMAAAVAQELHVGTAQVTAALQPLFAAGQADPSSPAFAEAARSLGVSTQQLAGALVQAKQSLGAAQAGQSPAGSKTAGSGTAGSGVGSKSAEEQQGHDAMAAAVAQELHVSTAQVTSALQPLFAAGQADPSSPVLAAAAHSLGVSTQQLLTALVHAKQSQAGGN